MFEYFVHKQLLDYCLKAGAIPDERFGFLPQRSTVWQLLFVLEDIDSKVHACFLGISKAFDRVDHGLLLCTLSDVGIKDKEF